MRAVPIKPPRANWRPRMHRRAFHQSESCSSLLRGCRVAYPWPRMIHVELFPGRAPAVILGWSYCKVICKGIVHSGFNYRGSRSCIGNLARTHRLKTDCCVALT